MFVVLLLVARACVASGLLDVLRGRLDAVWVLFNPVNVVVYLYALF